jgi:hypothetical protein
MGLNCALSARFGAGSIQHDRWPRVTDRRRAADGKTCSVAHEIGAGAANFLADQLVGICCARMRPASTEPSSFAR